MKYQKPETNRPIPAMIVYNVPKDRDDVQTVIFMRDEASENFDQDTFLAAKVMARGVPATRLSGMMPA